jgi:hypothetical protein
VGHYSPLETKLVKEQRAPWSRPTMRSAWGDINPGGVCGIATEIWWTEKIGPSCSRHVGVILIHFHLWISGRIALTLCLHHGRKEGLGIDELGDWGGVTEVFRPCGRG